MWFVYILLCADGSFYTGSSNNPDKRLLDHMTGKGAKYTKSHKPIKRVYLEQCSSKSAALKREIEIKRWNRHRKIKQLQLRIEEF